MNRKNIAWLIMGMTTATLYVAKLTKYPELTYKMVLLPIALPFLLMIGFVALLLVVIVVAEIAGIFFDFD